MILIGAHPLWHPVFETLAYSVAYWVYRRVRARQGDVVAEPRRRPSSRWSTTPP